MKTNYDERANDFLRKTSASITVKYIETAKYLDDDKEIRDIYEVTIEKGEREYTFKYGNSIHNSGRVHAITSYCKRLNGDNTVITVKDKIISHRKMKVMLKTHDLMKDTDYKINRNYCEPSYYDILATMTKYDPGLLSDFCSDFGYDIDSKQAEKSYNAVKNEYINLAMLFSDSELEMMQEIQ